MDSDFVPIPVHVIKTRKHDQHKENIERIMTKYVESDESRQFKLGTNKDIPSPILSRKPPSGSRTLPTQRKFESNSSRGLQLKNKTLVLPFGGGNQEEFDWLRDEKSLRRQSSLDNVDNDIETIWKGIKDFEDIHNDDLPPPLPPKSPKLLARSRSLSKQSNVSSEKQKMKRYNSSTMNNASNSSRDSSVSKHSRDRSQTPSKVTFKTPTSPVKQSERLDWVDFKSTGKFSTIKIFKYFSNSFILLRRVAYRCNSSTNNS